jgi:tetratricopeptide (TPR) repeat protein
MDAAGAAAAGQSPMRTTVLILLIAVCPALIRAQSEPADSSSISRIRALVAEERWHEIIRLAEAESQPGPDISLFHGTALARLERWGEAIRVFKRARNEYPRDKRFLIELAGVAFKQRAHAEAADYLRSALRLDPGDRYALDFLASVYFLQGNLQAALKYWNRVSKPRVQEVQLDPALKVDSVLLDRAMAFAPAAELGLRELRTSEARIEGLNIFPQFRFDLEARSDGNFDLVFRARERKGWGANRWETLATLLRGLPLRTIHPEVFNIGQRAVNLISLLRWDSEKRRLWSSLSGPFASDPKWRYLIDLDFRDENWEIRDSTGAPARGRLNLKKQAFGAAVTSYASGRLEWSAGLELSHRDFAGVVAGTALTPRLLTEGFQLKQLARLDLEIVHRPERRFRMTAGGSAELARIWSDGSNAFARLQGGLRAHWLPRAAGDDLETEARIRAGATAGNAPFDELFVLGAERDNDLWLRGHIGTRDGRKGSAPLGRSYLLANWELDKTLYGNGLINIKLGPFLDAGKISDPTPGLGSGKWLCDAGAQVKVRVLGVGLALSYGRDLRSGSGGFYLWMVR